MPEFEPRDQMFEARVGESFDRQQFAGFIGAELISVLPGAVDIRLPFKAELTQQSGYVHGGVLTSIADTAAGYAALTLAPKEFGVLTTELKVNFLRPAGRCPLLARGRVIKPGRTLNIVQADVVELTESGEIHVLTGLVTMMFVKGLD